MHWIRGTANQTPLLGYFVQKVGQCREVWSLIRTEGPADEQQVFDVLGGLQVSKRRPHTLAYQPNDGLRRYVPPRPLARQQLEPDSAECKNVAGFGEGQLFPVARVNAQRAHDLGSQIAQPCLGDAHAFSETEIERSGDVCEGAEIRGQMTVTYMYANI